MESFLETLSRYQFFGNSLIDWLLFLLVGSALYLCLTLVFRILKSRTSSLSQKTATVADDVLARSLEATKQWFLLIAAFWGGGRFLERGSADAAFDTVLLLAITLQLAFWANRAVSAYIELYTDKRQEDNPNSVSAVQGMSFLIRLVVWSIALLLIIDNLGYDVTALVAGLGIGGIAIALAVQNILGDLFASLSIILDKPFVIGDFIIVGDLLGVVEKIGIKTTRVRSLSGEQLIFANSDLLNSRIRNFKRMQERRIPFNFGVIYQTSADQLEKIPPCIKDIIANIEGARFDRAHFKSFGSSSYDFEVVYYINTPDYNIYMDTQQTINLAMCRAFKEMGIEFAYPTRTIYMAGSDKTSGTESTPDEARSRVPDPD
ncbi:MAG TPA: mechanosensitive ion channel family protein [Opitutales bacterium]|nr:mechanosensitive ion channel family protein [Opitutales bacterium]